MSDIVTIFCLFASGLCLLGFAAITILTFMRTPTDAVFATKSAVTTRSVGAESADSLAKLVEATSKLVDSITKAGPGVAALAGSILFAAISAYLASPPLRNDVTAATSKQTSEPGMKPHSDAWTPSTGNEQPAGGDKK